MSLSVMDKGQASCILVNELYGVFFKNLCVIYLVVIRWIIKIIFSNLI